MTARGTSMRVVVLAHDGMNVLDLTGPVQTLHTANRRHGAAPAPYDVVVASEHGGLILTSAGLEVMTVALDALAGLAIDTLIAPGGCKGEEYQVSPRLAAWVRERASSVRRLCSVCTGAFLLAAAGQLDGRRAATHWHWAARLQAAYPAVAVDPDRIFIRDGAVWTSAGVTAGIDLTLALVEADLGHAVAIDTARQLVVFMKRSGGQSQFSAPLLAQAAEVDDFVELHAWVAAHLDQDLRIERLAEHVNMSPRNFARVYLAKAGSTPARMVETLRLEAARRLLEETELPLKRIAALTGHADELNLRRTFQRRMSVTPGAYRERFSAHDEPVAE